MKAACKTSFFILLTEYDKLLQQLSKQCGELSTVGSSSSQSNLCEMCRWLTILQQLCWFCMRIIQLRAMLIDYIMWCFRILMCWAPHLWNAGFRIAKETEMYAINRELILLSLTVSAVSAVSAGPLRIESTAEGFKLYCSLKCYINYLKTSWHFK